MRASIILPLIVAAASALPTLAVSLDARADVAYVLQLR